MPTHITGDILALLTAVAGWFYLFYSKAAQRLTGIEEDPANRVRVRLRRVGGAVMLSIGVCLYIGFEGADPTSRPVVFVAAWIAVMVLLVLLALLAFIDIRLTMKLRRRQQLNAASTHRSPSQDHQDHA